MELYFTKLEWEHHCFPIAATSDGLCYVGAFDEPSVLFEDWKRKYLPRAEVLIDDSRINPYREQLLGYLQGERTAFTLPLHPIGTPFQLDVWQALQTVPYGNTTTYSEIAAAVARPRAIRAVGTAIGKNRLLLVIPCHRIVGKNGDLIGYWGGLNMKRRLLALEQEIRPNSM